MKKVLFIDRDGTLIVEPPKDFQVDSLEKLEFYPGVFRNLYKIRNYLDYELAVVSNQDGLGSKSFPFKNFKKPNEKFLKAFKNEGVEFDEVFYDPSKPEDNSPSRKPGTGMLGKYLDGDYDLENSFVIGDRLTDLQLAANLGAKGILIGGRNAAAEVKSAKLNSTCALITTDWDDIWIFLSNLQRRALIKRKTKETDISIDLRVDGKGECEISTGLGFFDHMLEQIGKHAGCDLRIKVSGDLHVDEHHTVEDTAIALGEAFLKALDDKKGMMRYGFLLPMDDCLAQVAIDFGGRAWIVWDASFKREKVGDVPTELFYHFFKSFSDAARCNLNIKAEGENEHHKIEAIFKAFSRAIRMAVTRDAMSNDLPTTKGVL
ncbi:MAG: bifunctional histidinol-phosphatase/imidazoleglycerol-phosphate dehydratase HisB [Bacteroidales bacterium]|nr:bifunctional histidinol-phosphatase/imidazoleglycerol-phosphate dehydratase HisB [Bacteroidales bacterium]